MSHITVVCRILVLSIIASIFPLSSLAAGDSDGWPNAKPITWIVGFSPGGSTDVLTRAAARQLAIKTGQPVIVDNRPGAAGAIALQAAAKAAPDGYTLISVPGPNLFSSHQPELGKELISVAMLAQGPMILVGPASNTQKTVPELIADMKKDPNGWNYANSGTGTSQHLAGELFNVMAGTGMTQVPYKGGAQAVTDVIGAQVPLAVLGVAPVLPHIKSGKLKAYAVTTNYRIESLPEVPTMQEAGLKGYNAAQWYVVGAPAGVPADRIANLNVWLNEIATSLETKPTLVSSGAVAGTGSSKEVQTFVDTEMRKWKDLAKRINLQW